MKEARKHQHHENGSEEGASLPSMPVFEKGDVIIRARVIRANGKVEDLGIVSHSKDQLIPVELLKRLKKGGSTDISELGSITK